MPQDDKHPQDKPVLGYAPVQSTVSRSRFVRVSSVMGILMWGVLLGGASTAVWYWGLRQGLWQGALALWGLALFYLLIEMLNFLRQSLWAARISTTGLFLVAFMIIQLLSGQANPIAYIQIPYLLVGLVYVGVVLWGRLIWLHHVRKVWLAEKLPAQ